MAREVFFVMRRHVWIFGRTDERGLPYDLRFLKYYYNWMQQNLPSLHNWIVESRLTKRCDHELYGIKPELGPYQQSHLIQDDLPIRIACGGVKVKPAVKEFSEDGAFFQDGTHEKLDMAILATGYTIDFPFLEEGVIPIRENQVSLYKFMLQPHLKHPETLVAVGLIQPVGAIMPCAELQVRYFAELFTKKQSLPSMADMMADIQRHKDFLKVRYVNSRRHTIHVDPLPLMEDLARLIGATPPGLPELLLKDPVLAVALYTGPVAPYAYRLKGPHQWNGARNAMLKITDRVAAPFSGNRPARSYLSTSIYDWLAVFVIMAVFLFWFVR
jgi:dimethylaniline monooxygenase (N-oxide forming)